MRRICPRAFVFVVAAVALAGMARAHAADPAPAADEVPAADLQGYVPAQESPSFTLSGYVDVGFVDADGDGTSFARGDQRLPIDYASDPFMTAVNSRGDAASTDTGGRFSNGFLPRSAGVGGRPSFLLNTLSLDLRHGSAGDTVMVFARAHLVPRLERAAGSITRLYVEQAFGRVQPFASHELLLFAGKFDSVFGIEYLENQAPLRTGITPSLLARYTTGTSIGGKVFFRQLIEPLASAVSVNVAVTNSLPFIEVLQAPDVSLTGTPAFSARVGYELNLRGLQLKLGGSGMRGPRNDQGSPDAIAKALGGDARLTFSVVSLSGEYLHLDEERGPAAEKLTGAGQQTIASAFHVRGGWAQLALSLPFSTDLFRRTILYVRGEQRRGWFEGFARVRGRRLTVGVRLDLGDAVALKLETLFNREYEGAPDVDNDVRTASLIWSY
jgi:hypothetical protein